MLISQTTESTPEHEHTILHWGGAHLLLDLTHFSDVLMKELPNDSGCSVNDKGRTRIQLTKLTRVLNRFKQGFSLTLFSLCILIQIVILIKTLQKQSWLISTVTVQVSAWRIQKTRKRKCCFFRKQIKGWHQSGSNLNCFHHLQLNESPLDTVGVFPCNPLQRVFAIYLRFGILEQTTRKPRQLPTLNTTHRELDSIARVSTETC